MSDINKVRAVYLKRLYPNYPVVGVGIVIVHQNKIVLIKRGNEPAKGKWTIPGGLVELGESLENAVIREAKEETCLDVEEPHLVDIVNQVEYDSDGKVKYHYVIIDYIVQVKGGEIQAASDATELRWVSFDEVDKYELTASFRLFFRKNRKKLEQTNSYL